MNRRAFLRSVIVSTLVAPLVPRLVKAQPLCRCGKPMGAHRPFDMQRDYIQPAVDKLAADIDARFLAAYDAELLMRRQAQRDLAFVSGGQW